MDKLKEQLKRNNSTTVGTTTIGGAISIVLVVVANKFGAGLTGEESVIIGAALTTVINYFVPFKK